MDTRARYQTETIAEIDRVKKGGFPGRLRAQDTSGSIKLPGLHRELLLRDHFKGLLTKIEGATMVPDSIVPGRVHDGAAYGDRAISTLPALLGRDILMAMTSMVGRSQAHRSLPWLYRGPTGNLQVTRGKL